MGHKRIEIPYNDAGIHAFEIIREVAEQLYEKGQRITADFVREAAPTAETTDTYCKGGKFIRVIHTPDGQRATIAYDYRTKEVKELTEKEAKKWERQPQPAASATAY